jgi:hypothetical protein
MMLGAFSSPGNSETVPDGRDIDFTVLFSASMTYALGSGSVPPGIKDTGRAKIKEIAVRKSMERLGL